MKQQIEADLVLIASIAEVLRRCRNHAMSDLRVKDTIAIDTVLIDQSGAVLAKIVEDLDNVAARQNLLEVAR